MSEKEAILLTKQSFADPESLPDWLLEEYAVFADIVTDQSFPCYFGVSAQKRGELRYSYITHGAWGHLPETLRAFNQLFTRKENTRRHAFFLFVEPEKEEKSLSYYRNYFWNILQYLYDHDDTPWPEAYSKDPDHYLWSFSFAQEPYFVFGYAPAYKKRQTRDLGNGWVMGFRPRRIFRVLEGTSSGAMRSRKIVRERGDLADELSKHLNIGDEGDEKHMESKEYYAGDDIEAVTGTRPLKHKYHKEMNPGAIAKCYIFLLL